MPRLRYQPGDDLVRLFPDFHWAPAPGDEIEVTAEQADAVHSPFLAVVPDAPEKKPAKERV